METGTGRHPQRHTDSPPTYTHTWELDAQLGSLTQEVPLGNHGPAPTTTHTWSGLVVLFNLLTC